MFIFSRAKTTRTRTPKEKTRRRWILASVGAALLALLIAVRVSVPYIALKQLNKYLAGFSPDYSLHIDNLHLSFLRMAYRFDRIEGRFKKDDHVFLNVDSVDVSIAWRELLHARILTDIVVDRGCFILTQKLISGSKERDAKPTQDATAAADKLFPVDVARVEMHHSSIEFADLIGSGKAEQWRISAVEARVLNLTPAKHTPVTFATLQGTLLGSSPFRVAAQARRLEQPPAFKAELELHDFDLVAANPMLMKFVPLSFLAGHLDVFAEAKSQGGGLEGYVKPFFKKLDVIDVHEHFVGFKHFAIELVVALVDVILRRNDDKSVAAQVEFQGSLKHPRLKIGKIITTALDHGFRQHLSPSLERRFELK